MNFKTIQIYTEKRLTPENLAAIEVAHNAILIQEYSLVGVVGSLDGATVYYCRYPSRGPFDLVLEIPFSNIKPSMNMSVKGVKHPIASLSPAKVLLKITDIPLRDLKYLAAHEVLLTTLKRAVELETTL